MAKLRVIEGAETGTELVLTESVVTIGRDTANQLRLADAKSSRVHAEIRLVDGRHVLVDRASANGTWVADGRVDSLPLSDGAEFRIGRTRIRFESRDALAAPPEQLDGLDDDPGSSLLRLTGIADAGRLNAYLVLLHRLVLKSENVHERDGLFSVLDDAATEVLERDRLAVFLPTPDGWQLWPPHEIRLRARHGAAPFARTLLAAVHARRVALRSAVAGDLSPSASMLDAGVRSAMCAPLRIGDEIHAALYVDRLTSGTAYTATDLAFLAAAANQLAVRLHHLDRVANLEAEVARLRAVPARAELMLIGNDAVLRDFSAKAAVSDAAVAIGGEPGSGREHLARVIHQGSARAERPFQVVACAGNDHVDALLFGSASRPGQIELADRGSVFLDDADALPPLVQQRLATLVERGEFRHDDGAVRRVDVRVFAATAPAVAGNAPAGLHGDFARRLPLTITVPALRHRPSDLEPLIDHFLHDHARRQQQPAKRLAPEARALVLRHRWPGNVRELRNAIERGAALASGASVTAADLPEAIRAGDAALGSSVMLAGAAGTPLIALSVLEKAHILRVLEHVGGNKKACAEVLGIDRSTLYAKLKQYGLA